MLEINNLTKRFDKFVVFDNISLKIADGSIFGLVGQFRSEEYEAEYNICKECITHPGDSECQSHVDAVS